MVFDNHRIFLCLSVVGFFAVLLLYLQVKLRPLFSLSYLIPTTSTNQQERGWIDQAQLNLAVHCVVVRDARSQLDKTPTILAWTTFFDASLSSRFKATLYQCPYHCHITADRKYLQDANAVVFHIRDLNLSDLPATRSQNQFYVFYLKESPHHTGAALRLTSNRKKKAIPNDFFNITMTYRKDSDIFSGYGNLLKIGKNEQKRRRHEEIKKRLRGNLSAEDLIMFFQDKHMSLKQLNISLEVKQSGSQLDVGESIAQKIFQRPNFVLQFVSNCRTPSRREIYTKQLKQYINVTQLGICTGKKCSSHCERKAVEDHKFYLSFENSICRDYITEKLFCRLGKLLPIVLKRAAYAGIVPDDAFIAADDFKCPKDLANHLKFLSRNFTAFSKYFQWMKQWKVRTARAGCELCQFLYENNGVVKIVPNIRKWWVDDARCEKDYTRRLICQRNATNATPKSLQ
ncbi:unnamed protein product [Enterobius vermicularis]|uniref:Fucosyltransferase n=1 Tax=Enterobius vermicularis TaxID=51028 RepID=A0A0N4USW3_ENTVE|nr:unnamed protein product [Enterobius vermicularis]